MCVCRCVCWLNVRAAHAVQSVGGGHNRYMMWADMHACAHCQSTIDISHSLALTHSLTDMPAYCIYIGVYAIFVRTCMYMYMYMCMHVSVLLHCCVVVRAAVHLPIS